MRCLYYLPTISLVASALFESAYGFSVFNKNCNETYFRYHLNDSRPGLVDSHGKPVASINLAAGIDIKKCYEVCGGGYDDFNFQNFALSFTTWLLPWLALIAQLPYEASNPWSNLMSLLLALGSPALIAQSVTLTILNGYWIRQKFKELWGRSRRFLIQTRFDDRIKAAALLVQESQQVPMRVSEDDGWLSSLIVLGENQSWWKNTENHIWSTRRGVTFSLVAQILMAFIAWFFTALGAAIGNLGDTTTALQLSSGSLWLWMIPVILGWIMAGTQSDARAIGRAIGDMNHPATLACGQPGTNGSNFRRGSQNGILNRSGFASAAGAPQNVLNGYARHGDQPVNHDVDIELQFVGQQASQDGGPRGAPRPPPRPQSFQWCSSNVAGDGVEAGPIYNYARLLTWWSFAETIEKAFRKTVENIEQQQTVNGEPWGDVVRTRGPRSNGAAASEPESNVNEPVLFGSHMQVARYCGLEGGRLRAYLEWGSIPSKAWQHMFYSILVALWVQWGTTGAALMMAYLTPTVGLGCRSGSYLLYGSVATLSWLLLLLSSLFSHAAMLRYQRLHGNLGRFLEETRSGLLWRKVLGGLAVVTRKVGKTLAALNAMFLFTSCIFEYSGFYNRCWCSTDALSLHGKGYSVIFLTASDLAAYSQRYWAGGIVFLIAVTGVVWLCFGLFCMDNWRNEN